MDTQILIVCLNAVLPTFLLMATGFVSRQLKLLGDRDVSMMNNLAFKVFMPAMLFCNIYTSDIASAVRPRLLIFAVAGVLAAFALGTPVEKQLALQLLQFGPTVLRAAESYKPSVLADYLFQTAQLYSSFYQRAPILKSEPAVRDARLALCALFGKVLAKGLSLLGIETPNRI